MNKVFEKDGKQRVVQDKGEEIAAIFEGYKEVDPTKGATPAAATSSEKSK